MWRTRLTQAAALGLLALLGSLSFSVVRPTGFHVREAARSEHSPAPPAVAVARRVPIADAVAEPAVAAPVTASPEAVAPPAAPPGQASVGGPAKEGTSEVPAPRPPVTHRLVGRFGWVLERSACPPSDSAGRQPKPPDSPTKNARRDPPDKCSGALVVARDPVMSSKATTKAPGER